MKPLKFLFLIGLLVICSCGYAQEYHVLQVKGVITANEKPLKSGDVLKASDKLQFSKPTDAVAVVDPKFGRFIIKPKTSEAGSEFVAIVKEIVTPGIKRLSTRSGPVNNVVDFQTRFQHPVVLLDEMRVPVSGKAFSMGDSSFFFIRFNHRGEQINKRLGFSADTLLINRRALFSIDGLPIDPEQAIDLQLFYFASGQVRHITPVRFELPDLSTLSLEMRGLSETLDSKRLDASEECFLYTTEIYGHLAREDFMRWYAGQR